MPLWLKQKLWISELIKKELGYNGKVLFSTHHESHAASAFYPSPFKHAAFLTLDGVGEWKAQASGRNGNNLEIMNYLKFPHSLGLFYSAFTYYCGFKVNSGEYKLMGLAPYGIPKYSELILKELIDLKADGSFKLNMKYFAYTYAMRMINRRFEKLFGQPTRKSETRITQHYMDVAASVQKVTEEVMLRMASHVHKITALTSFALPRRCLELRRQRPYLARRTVQRNLDPAGKRRCRRSISAALLIWYKYLKNPREANETGDKQKASLLALRIATNLLKTF